MAESRSLTPLWSGLPSDPKAAASALLKSFLEGRKETTFKTYRQGLESFVRFVGARSVEEAAGRLLSLRHGDANKMALDFRNWLVKAGRKAATVNNRVAALRSLVNLARTLGIVSWQLEVKGLKEQKYRDTAGPGFEPVLGKVRSLASAEGPRAARDAALVALMGVMGLRRGEVVGLDLSSLDGGTLRVVGKGKTEKEPLTVPTEVLSLLAKWVEHRGKAPGPLFARVRKDGSIGKGRLTGRSVGRITNALGLGNAHGLRHSAITAALDRNNGDVRKTARFSRHGNIQTLVKYDDNRRDLGGEVAKDLAKGLEKETP